jgi:hypothetical protein
MSKDGIELPHNVTEYLSYSVRSNIRELEGVLISLIAEAALNQREIDMDLAKEVISKFVDHVSNEISIEFIQKIVASNYNIPVEQLKDKNLYSEIESIFGRKFIPQENMHQIILSYFQRIYSPYAIVISMFNPQHIKINQQAVQQEKVSKEQFESFERLLILHKII